MQGMMMQYSEERTANAVGGKTARACENCLRKRARWFCGADDAFLCQACDKSVHSANQLASRHERVRLETSSTGSTTSSTPPVWHQGFTRKARTPRHNHHNNKNKKEGIHVNSLPLVPEIGGEESCLEENEEEELLYRVPEFDLTDGKELNFLLDGGNDDDNNNIDIDIDTCGMELISSDDAELAEFAADVESLLNDDNNSSKRSSVVKIENDEEDESFSWDDYFDYSAASPVINNNNNNGEDEDMKKEMMMMTTINGKLLETKEEEEEEGKMIPWKISLKLNYEEVMNAWDNNNLQLHQAGGCPWINGIRPDFNLSDDSWPDFLLLENGTGTYQQYPPYGAGGGGCRNEEREARVSRYREKRRTRLFSKKIRYEVRKLNAEKRPRMKGRFVKRIATPSSSSSTFSNNNYLPNY